MGTSKQYGGPGKGLVPSWVDEPVQGAQQAPAGTLPALVLGPQPTTLPPAPPPPHPATPVPSMTTARRAMTSFRRDADPAALPRATSRYVRSGTGGARQAAQRMGVARKTASVLLGALRDFRELGAKKALRRLNLQALASLSASNIMLALMEVICPPGGTIDDGIARQAMAEALGDLAEAGAGKLSADTLEDFFLSFVVRSIEGRIIADIGARGIKLPAANDDLQDQLHEFVEGCTRSSIKDKVQDLTNVTDKQLAPLMNEIYELGFRLIAAMAEDD